MLAIEVYEELSHPKERAVMGCLFIGAYDIGGLKCDRLRESLS